MNKVILMGNLVRDVEIRYTQGAEPLAVANFSIAVRRRFKREGETDADFINCVCFGKQGETIGKYFTKGRKISVVGRLQVRNWQDKNGNKRVSTEVIVDEFYFCDSKGNSGTTAEKSDSKGYTEEASDDDDLPF